MKTKIELLLGKNMSELSNSQGRGYEYACIFELNKAINLHRACDIIKNKSLIAAEKAYNLLTSAQKDVFHRSAEAMIPVIFECEPLIIEKDC